MLDIRPAPGGTRDDRRPARPTGVGRTFPPDELIVSKTDRRGVLTYANDVFLHARRPGINAARAAIQQAISFLAEMSR